MQYPTAASSIMLCARGADCTIFEEEKKLTVKMGRGKHLKQTKPPTQPYVT